MSALTIPCEPRGQALWSELVTLDGRDYLLTFRWSQRMGRWSLDVADQDGAPIVAGQVLAPGFGVLRGSIDTRRPVGDLVLLDTGASSGPIADPTFASLGARHLLLYLDGDELAAVREVVP
jgi:hypothetical protein